MFNRKLLGLLASLHLARAASYDSCAVSACGSAANSPNPYNEMIKLLQSGINCQNQGMYNNNPLTPPANPHSNGGDSCVVPGFYPQQAGNSTGYSPTNYNYSMNGSGLPGMNNGAGKDEECEVTTSIECKPRRGGQNLPPTYSYGPNSSIMMNNMIGGGSPTTRPNTMPGSNQVCDCSQAMGGMASAGCDCGQQQYYNQGGGNAMFTGGNTGGRGPYDMSMMGGRSSVFESFDCCRPQTYQLPPIKTAIVGTTELPISDNVRITSSSCGPAPCL
jgi:hypothetical protein